MSLWNRIKWIQISSRFAVDSSAASPNLNPLIKIITKTLNLLNLAIFKNYCNFLSSKPQKSLKSFLAKQKKITQNSQKAIEMLIVHKNSQRI